MKIRFHYGSLARLNNISLYYSQHLPIYNNHGQLCVQVKCFIPLFSHVLPMLISLYFRFTCFILLFNCVLAFSLYLKQCWSVLHAIFTLSFKISYYSLTYTSEVKPSTGPKNSSPTHPFIKSRIEGRGGLTIFYLFQYYL